jgi:hypothetical protein
MIHDKAYFCDITMTEYLADRGRLSGHVLSMVDREPERFGEWLAGKSDDRSSPAMDQGIYFNDRLLEPAEVARRYAFLPSRAEALEPVMVPAIGTRGKTKGQPLKRLVPKLDEFGEPVTRPQDPEAPHRSMRKKSPHAKAIYEAFMANARRERLTVITPEQQTTVEAMIRAVRAHPVAAKLLERGRPEVTIHWTCPETREPLQARPDWLDEGWYDEATRRHVPLAVEVKTVMPKTGRRLNTLSSSAVNGWIRDRWPTKSALLHDGVTAVCGDSLVAWIVVEAVEKSPRVSVVWDRKEHVGSFYTIGRDGVVDRDGRPLFRGYLELVREAQQRRAAKLFSHECTIGALDSWPLPGWVLSAMEADTQKAPPLVGARKVAHGVG